jgi:hypothetical protein
VAVLPQPGGHEALPLGVAVANRHESNAGHGGTPTYRM